MNTRTLSLGLLLLAAIPVGALASTWDGTQYFNKGVQCDIVPEKAKKASDDAAAGMKMGHMECYGKKMRMEIQSDAPAPVRPGKAAGRHNGQAKSDEMRNMMRNMIMITDLSVHKSYMLMPEKKIYIETDLSEALGKDRANDLFSRKADLEELGHERVDGHDCRKVRPSWSDSKGKKEKFGEIMWLAGDLHDFPVQSMIESTGDIMHYRDIKFGAIPGSHFEIPGGYTKSSMEDMLGASMSPADRAHMHEAMQKMKERMNSKDGKEAMEKMKEAMKKQEEGK